MHQDNRNASDGVNKEMTIDDVDLGLDEKK